MPGDKNCLICTGSEIQENGKRIDDTIITSKCNSCDNGFASYNFTLNITTVNDPQPPSLKYTNASLLICRQCKTIYEELDN